MVRQINEVKTPAGSPSLPQSPPPPLHPFAFESKARAQAKSYTEEDLDLLNGLIFKDGRLQATPDLQKRFKVMGPSITELHFMHWQLQVQREVFIQSGCLVDPGPMLMDLGFLEELLLHFPNLEWISLDCTADVACHLHRFRKLRHVAIDSSCRFDDATFEKFAKSLPELLTLAVDFETVSTPLKFLPLFKKVDFLGLGNLCEINTTFLMDSLTKLPHLKKLLLSCNSCEDFKFQAETLQALGQLHLDEISFESTSSGVKFKRMFPFKNVDLNCCQADSDDEEELEAKEDTGKIQVRKRRGAETLERKTECVDGEPL